MRVRKVPVVVEAFRLFIDERPQWWLDALAVEDGEEPGNAREYESWPDVRHPHALIMTLEGVHRAERGDWIIQGVQGEIYPCKPDIFAKTYVVLSA